MKPLGTDTTNPAVRAAAASLLIWMTLLVAALAVAGSLALSLYEDKKACALCFYQRTCALGLVAMLVVGLLTRPVRGPALALLALPLALGGLGVAAFHVNLERTGTLECPPGLFGVLTAPKQSLIAFAVLSALLAVEVLRGVKAQAVGLLGVAAALLLGGGIVWGSVSANPPPPKPTKKYDKDVPDTCRIPYHEPAQEQ
jgi:disulfide bond formation protein DsbB